MVDHDKRNSLRGIARTGISLVALGFAATQARAQDVKVAQNLVQYQTTPKDGQECDKCVNWAPPNACKIVEGKIEPKGYCVAYAPKEG